MLRQLHPLIPARILCLFLFILCLLPVSRAQDENAWLELTVEEMMEQEITIESTLSSIYGMSDEDMLKAMDKAIALYAAAGGDYDRLLMPDVYFIKSVALCQLDHYDEATAALNELKENGFPVFDTNNLLKSEAYAKLGDANVVSARDKDYQKAKSIIEESINILPTFNAYKFKAVMHQMMEESDSLEYTYTKALEAPFAPTVEFAAMLEKRGRLYFDQKLYAKAKDDFTKTLSYGPSCISSYYRARCILESNQYQDKSEANQDMMSIVNDDCGMLGAAPLSYIHEKLGDYYQEIGSYSSALTYYSNSYNYDPYYYNTGWAAIAALSSQNYSACINWASKFEAELQRTRSSDYLSWLAGEVFYASGYAHWQNGNTDRTVRDFERAKRLGNQTAAQYLRDYFNR
ncbi:MAG: hypothetical protein R8G66_09885 [Cytophagales bacterium]|nr:hypothetical protein [Cytophagales bacterium]